MRARTKGLIGLMVALLCGLLWHGPVGRGDMFTQGLQRRVDLMVEAAELRQVEAVLARDPLRRVVELNGQADDFQREGQRRFPGINDRILSIAGVSAIDWQDEPGGPGLLPLPVWTETLIQVSLFFLLGLLLGWRFFAPKPERYLSD